MEIVFADGWNGMDGKFPNHESARTEQDICLLIEQVRVLPGISTKAWDGMPKYVKMFAEKCVYGTFKVTVAKGIHQRWRSGYKRENPPDPHITIGAKISGNKPVFFHVLLSETGVGAGQYTWKTVGLTYVGKSDKGAAIERWPAAIIQTTTNIQDDHKTPHLRRTLSVGCLPPPPA